MRTSIGPVDIKEGFQRAGIISGDTLMLHSDAGVLAQLPEGSTEDRMKVFINALLDLLGEEGTLVVPTFTYSFSSNEVYSVISSPSKVGSLTDYLRKLPNAKRSLDPMFSVAAIGPKADELLSGPALNCFGKDSPFARLHQFKAKLAFCGCSFNRATFIHYVEQSANVSYRFFKPFSGMILDKDNCEMNREISFFARKLDLNFFSDLSELKRRMMASGKIQTGMIGRVEVIGAKTEDVFESANALLAENPYGLTTLAQANVPAST